MSDKDIIINNIDAGKSFNWGKTSKDYATCMSVEDVINYLKQ